MHGRRGGQVVGGRVSVYTLEGVGKIELAVVIYKVKAVKEVRFGFGWQQ